MQHSLEINAIASFTLAILLLFIGKGLSNRITWLQKYSIPEPVIGGLVCTVMVCMAYYLLDLRISFTLGVRDMLLLYFFAAIGLNTNIQTLKQGGRALIILVIVASIFMVLQNLLGMSIAQYFDMDPRIGLMAGSISLTGGVGTTMAWASHFVNTLGLDNAVEIGIASNMVGMIAACMIGGPIASLLIKRHRIQTSADPELDIGMRYQDEPYKRLNYYGVLMAIFWLNICLIMGRVIIRLIAFTGLNLPAFVGCLLAGIIIRSVTALVVPKGGRIWRWHSMQPGIALISDLCLGIFLTMALMGLQLWVLQPMITFITVTMILQILLVIAFILLVVFKVMGRDYEAAVMCSGFGGIALGSTATAIANMSAVTRVYGNAPRAFIVVPLVCGFFIDLINALIIGFLAR
ncbi:sodium/glutamate symporter [Advenella alkanexedens]|uniref:Sodium/glutamate symporter n=1 Tax=Advenella alkanexedens TaxID=1481665 RepID=A0ABS6NJC0_9BURK|nr:sodium/glutamate symporter [Advenella alkanexedens]MBV4395736.1 sodium/glutamate symporter [Advenella alkanexedens]